MRNKISKIFLCFLSACFAVSTFCVFASAAFVTGGTISHFVENDIYYQSCDIFTGYDVFDSNSSTDPAVKSFLTYKNWTSGYSYQYHIFPYIVVNGNVYISKNAACQLTTNGTGSSYNYVVNFGNDRFDFYDSGVKLPSELLDPFKLDTVDSDWFTRIWLDFSTGNMVVKLAENRAAYSSQHKCYSSLYTVTFDPTIDSSASTGVDFNQENTSSGSTIWHYTVSGNVAIASGSDFFYNLTDNTDTISYSQIASMQEQGSIIDSGYMMKHTGIMSADENTYSPSHSGGGGVVRSSSSAIILTGTQSAADKTNGGSLKTSGSWLTNPDSYGKISILLDDDFNYHDYYIRVSECSAINSIVRNQIENSDAYLAYQERTYSGTGVEWLDCLSDICTKALKNLSPWDESVNSAMKNVWSDIEQSILDEYCYHMNDIVFSLKSSITSDSLCFKSSDLPYCPTRVLSFSLRDYFSVVADNTYKIEVVDGVTGRVLDYTYLLAFKTVSNNTSDYFGFKVYKYSDYDTAYNDVINDTPVNYHTLTQSDKGTINSNYNPFNGNISYGGSDVSGSSFSSIIADSNSLSNFTGSIDSALNGVGYFFELCYGILPPVYLSIIATAAVGLVILRILGR